MTGDIDCDCLMPEVCVMREQERRMNNRERVLVQLIAAGVRGVTNRELLDEGGFRYGARLFELRREGYLIDTLPAGDGLFRFVLRGRNVEQPSLFQEARS